MPRRGPGCQGTARCWSQSYTLTASPTFPCKGRVVQTQDDRSTSRPGKPLWLSQSESTSATELSRRPLSALGTWPSRPSRPSSRLVPVASSEVVGPDGRDLRNTGIVSTRGTGRGTGTPGMPGTPIWGRAIGGRRCRRTGGVGGLVASPPASTGRAGRAAPRRTGWPSTTAAAAAAPGSSGRPGACGGGPSFRRMLRQRHGTATHEGANETEPAGPSRASTRIGGRPSRRGSRLPPRSPPRSAGPCATCGAQSTAVA